MTRTLIDRTYPGETPRPAVEVTKWENDNFLMAATPWGNSDAVREIAESYREYITASLADREATSPFAKLPHLSPLANNLRAATIFSNERACKKWNNDSYTSACEAVVLAFERHEMAWIQVGQPHLLLIRNEKLIPLETSSDLAVDFGQTAPMPGKLIGIDRQLDINVKSMVWHDGDRLVLLARSIIPSSFFNQDFSKDTQAILQDLFDSAVKENDRVPFWLAILG